MNGSRKRQVEWVERHERGENLRHQHPSQEVGSRVFPVTNQAPMQQQMYPFVPPQQQHPSDYVQGQAPFVLASRTNDSTYNGTAFPMGLSGTVGPSRISTAIPQQPKSANQIVPPTGIPFDNGEFAQTVPGYYPQAQLSRKSAEVKTFVQAYNTGPGAPANMQTPHDAKHSTGNTGFPGPYPTGTQGPIYTAGMNTSPNPETTDENFNHQRSIDEEATNNGTQIHAPGGNMMTAALRFQNLRKYHSDRAILRLHEFINTINQSGPKMADSEYWRKKMNEMFVPRATLRYTKKVNSEYKYFEIAALMMPMMWVALSTLDVRRIEIVMMQLRADTLSNGNVFFHTPALTFSYHYSDGSQITYHAHMKGSFSPALKLEWLDVLVHKFTPGLSWNSMEKMLRTRPETVVKLSQRLLEAKENDVKIAEEGKDAEQKQDATIHNTIKELQSNFKVFRNISDQGIHEGMMRVLQVGDVMSALTDVYLYQKDRNIKSPLESLSLYVKDTKDGANSSSMTENIDGRTSVENSDTFKTERLAAGSDPMAMGNASPACSPRDVKGMRSGSVESVPAVRRRRSNKAVSRSAKTPSDSTPSQDDRNGIPGTKKIKF